MSTDILKEAGVAVVLAALIATLTYAQDAWMPSMGTMLLLLALVVCVFAFVMFVWNERGGDERDSYLRAFASRIAFSLTGAVLLVGILFETLNNYMPSPWLGAALLALVVGKIIGQAYGRSKL